MRYGAARVAWLGCLCFGVSFGISAAVHAQTAPAQPLVDVKAQVEAREQQWWTALKTKDAAALRGHMGSEFVLIFVQRERFTRSRQTQAGPPLMSQRASRVPESRSSTSNTIR